MNERRKLSELFEEAGKAFLEISRIMLKHAEKEEKVSKRQFAVENKVERMEEKSKKILEDANKPFPETNKDMLKLVHKLKEKI